MIPPVSRRGSKFSFNILPGAPGGIIDIISSCAAAGLNIPSLLLMVVSESAWKGQIQVAQLKQADPNLHVTLRYYYGDSFAWLKKSNPPDWNNPDQRAAGKAFFQEYYDVIIAPNSDWVLADAHQGWNEPTAYGPGTASWQLGTMDGAESRGTKATIYNWSMGFPPETFWDDPAQWDVLRQARDRGHRIAIHGYMKPDQAPGQIDNVYLLRHSRIKNHLPSDLQNIQFEYTEFLTGYARDSFSWQRLASLMDRIDAIVRQDDSVISLDLFNWGTGGNERDWGLGDWSKYLAQFKARLLGYT